MRMDTLTNIQAQLLPWVQHNFGDRPGWQPALGLVEEVGELAHSYLKRAQGIRTDEPHDENIRDAVADIVIYLCDFCNSEGIDLQQQLVDVWDKVRRRDWKADSEKGGEQNG